VTRSNIDVRTNLAAVLGRLVQTMRPVLSEISPPPLIGKKMRVRPVPAVTRSIAILRLLGTQKQAMGVKAISDKLGLVPSTCLHILRVLVAENFVRVDPETKRYRSGAGW